MYDNNTIHSNNIIDFNVTFDGSPNSSVSDNNYMECPPTNMPLANILFMILYAVVCIIGLMGNTLVIYVGKSLRKHLFRIKLLYDAKINTIKLPYQQT